jgi:hypothetical protein
VAITPIVGASWNRINYFGDGSVGLSGFDFDHQRGYAMLRFRPVSRTLVHVGFEGNRLYDFRDSETTYKAWVPSINLRQFVTVAGFPLVVSYDLKYHDATRTVTLAEFDVLGADAERRWEHTFSAFYLMQYGKFTISTFGRFTFTNYTDWPGSSRKDSLFSFGASVQYPILSFLNVRAFFTQDVKRVNESSLGWPNYNKFDAGIGLSARFSF